MDDVWRAALVALAVMVAGCLGATEPQRAEPDLPAPGSTATDPSNPPPPPAPLLTDTLHLLAPPQVSPVAPSGVDAIRIPVNVTGAPVTVGSQDYLTWNIPIPLDSSTLTGEATFWIEVEGTVVNQDPEGSCFWHANLVPSSGNASGGNPTGVAVQDPVCGAEPVGVVPPGIREIHLEFPGRPIADGAGPHAFLILFADAALGPDGTIHVLTGTPEWDSHIRIEGLQVPVEAPSLLMG